MMSNDSAAEVQRLQQELDRLRLRNLQQEQYIHALTSQLHSRQSVPVQVSAVKLLLRYGWHIGLLSG